MKVFMYDLFTMVGGGSEIWPTVTGEGDMTD